jgi:prephenate dehydrogenase
LKLPIVGVIGVGAIGGSIGLRARRNGAKVLGTDNDGAALEAALELGAIDDIATRDELARISDTLVIGAHLEPTLREIERLAGLPDPKSGLILDVASVKLPVVAAATGLRNFVATHPMAGTERSGVRAARADLFEPRTWAYVPSGDAALDRRACEFIASMGASPFAIEAQAHDRGVALTSHMPQIIASCYGRLVRDAGTPMELCGPVARELLRVSEMSFTMWRDILPANAINIEPPLREMIAKLQAAAAALSREDAGGLASLFGEGRT